ncbi:MAG: YfiR family protein [Bacteroidetes bacterium]|nr:YfiR family protein [Bacteroidota bacterium]
MKNLNRGLHLLFLLCIGVAAASCVSKKKYNETQQQLTQQREISQNYRLRIDTLQQQVVLLTDSVKELDSLLESEKQKLIASRNANRPKASGPVKKSSLTKEEESGKKAVFMLSFARNVIWPANFMPGKIVIGVVDDDNLFYSQLRKTLEGKTAGGKPIEVKKYPAAAVAPCHILYIAHDQIGNFQKIKTGLKSSPTLLVTEEGVSGYTNSHINYYINDTKVQYSLNQPLIDKAGLKITQDLIKFADK